MAVSTGASFTDVTVMVAVSEAVLNAVVPPLPLAVDRMEPAAPEVWSQAR